MRKGTIVPLPSVIVAKSVPWQGSPVPPGRGRRPCV